MTLLLFCYYQHYATPRRFGITVLADEILVVCATGFFYFGMSFSSVQRCL